MNEEKQTKYIFVTGGVVSSLGKGLAASFDWLFAGNSRAESSDDETRSVYQC